MKLRHLSIFLLLGCLGSCDYYFYPEGLDKDSKLYVQCIAGNSDTTFINIQKAMGINSVGDIMPDVESVSLRINGKESPIEKYVPTPPEDIPFGTKDTPPEPFYPEEYVSYYTLRLYNLWCTDAPVREGDQISLEVKAKGMQEVSATSVVPDKVVIKEINVAPRCTTVTSFDNTYTEDYVSLDISLENASADDYYGITIEQEQETVLSYDDGRSESYTSKGYGRVIDWNADQGDVMSEIQGNGETWTEAYYNGWFIDSYGRGLMKLFPGSLIKDGHLKIDCSILLSEELESSYSEFDQQTGTWIPGGKMTSRRTGKFRLLFYKVSPEFYRFNRAQYLLENNALAELGLSPSTFSYTNVRGGFGVLAALTCNTTQWYPAPYAPER